MLQCCCMEVVNTMLRTSVRSLLSTWANYTVASLPDPGNQLCTDDFEGPSPHNVNLAAKVAASCKVYH